MDNLKITIESRGDTVHIETNRKPAVSEIAEIIVMFGKMIESNEKGDDVWREKNKGEE